MAHSRVSAGSRGSAARADFLEAFAKKQPCHPTFRDALETQKVCDAVLQSAQSHQWVTVDR